MAKEQRDEIEQWLCSRLAKHLKIGEEEVDRERAFADYGLTSLVLITIGGDLEEHLDRELAPSLLWKYPTVSALGQYLAELPADDAA